MYCTTDSNKLYSSFMSQISHCGFMWDQVDLDTLQRAKCAELEGTQMDLSDADVLCSIIQSELVLHCGGTTHGTEEALIESLIQAFDGDDGRDTLGVPLINSTRMSDILKSQWKKMARILQGQENTLVDNNHIFHCCFDKWPIHYKVFTVFYLKMSLMEWSIFTNKLIKCCRTTSWPSNSQRPRTSRWMRL